MCDRMLFRTQDLSEVKEYCCRSWTKILENSAPIQDFIFAKELRMGTYRHGCFCHYFWTATESSLVTKDLHHQV
jgi:hypothetical protein